MKWAIIGFLGLIGMTFMGTKPDSSNYDTITATVQSIDWRCKLKNGRSRQSSEIDYGDCSDDKDFIHNRENPKSRRIVFQGEAVIGVSYADAPSRGTGYAVVSIDAKRPEFYTVGEGATVKIGISKTNPDDTKLIEIVKPARPAL